MSNTDRVSNTPEEARIQKLEERMDDMVHVAELRELIDKWRDKGIPIHQQNPHPSESAGRKAADQLEELIEGGE